MKRIFTLLFFMMPLFAYAQQNDWANFGRYDAANEQLAANPYVVFMGDSIFDGWDDNQPAYFTENNFACRAIGGQVTSQMLVRFRADVINLKPEAVVILAGTNDIALNNGYISHEHIVENVISMIELARASGIRPVLCSVLPAGKYGWRPEVENVAEKIAALNVMLKEYAAANKIEWVDFYTPLALPDGSMNPAYTYDGVHPTSEGYLKMQETLFPYLQKYIKKAQKTRQVHF